MVTTSDILLLTFTGVIAVATAAGMFQDQIRAVAAPRSQDAPTRPKVRLTIELAPPDCHKTSWYIHPADLGETAPCYYYRFRITNIGNAAAREVEVFARELKRRDSSQEWRPVERFNPQYLFMGTLALFAVHARDLPRYLSPL